MKVAVLTLLTALSLAALTLPVSSCSKQSAPEEETEPIGDMTPKEIEAEALVLAEKDFTVFTDAWYDFIPSAQCIYPENITIKDIIDGGLKGKYVFVDGKKKCRLELNVTDSLDAKFSNTDSLLCSVNFVSGHADVEVLGSDFTMERDSTTVRVDVTENISVTLDGEDLPAMATLLYQIEYQSTEDNIESLVDAFNDKYCARLIYKGKDCGKLCLDVFQGHDGSLESDVVFVYKDGREYSTYGGMTPAALAVVVIANMFYLY